MAIRSFLARQARRPSGWFGRLIGSRAFNSKNRNLLADMVDAAPVRPGQRVLDVGFGPGMLIRWLADDLMAAAGGAAADGGPAVCGIDHSPDMVRVAGRANRAHVRDGRVELKQASLAAVPYPDAHFDTVFTANTVYFWPDPAANAAELHRVLKPGGRLLVGYRTPGQLATIPFTAEGFRYIEPEQLESELKQAGFAHAETVHKPVVHGLDSYIAVATKGAP